MANFWSCITSDQQKDRKRLGSVVPYIIQAETRRAAKQKFKEFCKLNNLSQAICSPIIQVDGLEEAIRVVQRRRELLENLESNAGEELQELAKV